MLQEYTHVVHPFEPVFSATSRILILGSLPSVKSRENNFYYGHPQNRFWKMLAKIFNEEMPDTITQKKEFLLRNQIALWDVIYECDISASSDSSIKNAIPNDIEKILRNTKIKTIIANGKTAHNLYRRFFGERFESEFGVKVISLPSTSPANAAWTLEKLVQEWEKEIKELF